MTFIQLSRTMVAHDIEPDDGTLTAEEADEVQRSQMLFQSIDTNSDGEIEPAELLSGLNKLGLRAPGGVMLSLVHAHNLVLQADGNGNGSIDENEFRMIASQLRQRMAAQEAEEARMAVQEAEEARKGRASPVTTTVDLTSLMQSWSCGRRDGGEDTLFTLAMTTGASAPRGPAAAPRPAEITDFTSLSPSRKWPGLHRHVTDRVGSEALPCNG